MNKPSTVLLFTQSYPYEVAVEHTFLKREVEFISLCFDKVIIVPQRIEGKKFNVPANVDIEESYALSYKENYKKRIRNKLHDLFTVLLIKDLLRKPSLIFHFSALERLIYFIFNVKNVNRWIIDFIRKINLPINQSIFYTYWLDHISMGIGLMKKKYPKIQTGPSTLEFSLWRRCQRCTRRRCQRY